MGIDRAAEASSETDPARYLASIRADGDTVLGLLARDPERRLPTCPDWTLRDLAAHLAVVYLHKTECTRLLREPVPWPPTVPETGPGEWMRAARDEMIEVFRAAGPAAPSHTWHEPDQTVGFWLLRMAVESAIHRVDAELAFGAPMAIDERTAEEAVDEALDVMLAGDWSDQPQAGADRSVLVRTPTRALRVSMSPERVDIEHCVDRDTVLAGEGVVTGSASEILLWLWRRIDTERIRAGGDPAAVARLRDWMAVIT